MPIIIAFAIMMTTHAELGALLAGIGAVVALGRWLAIDIARPDEYR